MSQAFNGEKEKLSNQINFYKKRISNMLEQS